MAQCCFSFLGSPAALPIPSKANVTPSCMPCLTLVSKRSVKIKASETKSDYRTYQALLRGGEEMSAVLQEMAELLEEVSGLDKETELAAIEMAATASIGQRLEKLDGSFMMALDFMISQTAKEHDDKKMQLLEVVKQSVLAQLDQKAPSQVQVVGLLCKTPQKEHRHHILRCSAGGGGACDKEDGEKLIVPAGNLNEIANQADDLIISMEEKPTVPDRKLLAKLVLVREEARSMMGGGILDERNRRGLKNLAEPEVKFISKLIALRPGPALRDIISNVMRGKDEGADHISEDEEDEPGEQTQHLLPVRPGMFLETVTKVLGGMYNTKVAGITVQNLDWIYKETLKILQEIAFT